jgi:LPXTG-site transpeptidase (sortase) family protein
MRLVLKNNWSILLGFLITVLAFSGMLVAVLFPALVAVDLSPNRSINTLELAQDYQASEFIQQEENELGEIEAITAIVESGDNQQDAPADAFIPQTGTSGQSSRVANSRTVNTTTNQPVAELPVRILIPSIELSAPVKSAPVEFESIAGKEFLRWLVPDEYAVGWHMTSALLGQTGNTVLNGHHNAYGEVFISLKDVTEGDTIFVDSESTRYIYQITNKMILPEKYESLETRMSNAQWILPSVDERLTLISCWPYESNTHRLIVVASPVGQESLVLNFD